MANIFRVLLVVHTLHFNAFNVPIAFLHQKYPLLCMNEYKNRVRLRHEKQ